MASPRAALIWFGLAVAIAAPLAIAATSPELAWRHPLYIAAGFAGIVGLALVLMQLLLVGGYLPGMPGPAGRRAHRWVGPGLVAMVVAHVGGLWLTSAPDVIDALLFQSPTPFSPWGVAAMWATFAAAALAALRTPLRIRAKVWRLAHTTLALAVVVGSVVHALLVEGAMEPISKAAFCILVLAAAAKVVADLRAWSVLTRRRDEANPP